MKFAAKFLHKAFYGEWADGSDYKGCLQDYVYETCCVDSDAKSIDDMCDHGREVSYNLLKKHCAGLKQWEADAGYRPDGTKNGLTLRGDYHVHYFKSTFHGKPCLYMVHSAIEYIWVKSGFKASFLKVKKTALPKSHQISLQEAQDRGYFGPVYHGTTEERRDLIDTQGFKVFEGEEGSGDIQHGYQNRGDYSMQHVGVPPPVHHLGYGVYFTTAKAIAKQFNYSGAGMKTYYLDIPNHETINFAAPNTMMKWWIKNGYDIQLAKKDRVAATKNLTNNLKSQWDAVWFKGKTIRKSLDGDQICVYDPNKIYEISSALSQSGEVGAKVRRKSDGMRGVITKRENIERMLEKFPAASSWIKPGAKWRLNVKWQKGGTDYNVQDVDVDFL